MKSASLNHVYRLVWNAALGLWQTASEVTASRGKSKSSKQLRLARRQAAELLALGALGGLGALPGLALGADLPTGGVVVAGSASIAQAGNALNIHQTTDKAAIDWQSFNVGSAHSVNFQQPSSSSVALNRVLGNDVSVIQGAINANGQVFLVNQNGVLFTPTAQVNVGGIVASTQNISTADFMAGNYKFSGSSTASVENQGSLTAGKGGVVALIAAKVVNSGSIVTPQGTVGLAAGNTVMVDLGGPVKILVSEGALNTAIAQSGGIKADGGTVYLTAKAAGDLASSVINHSGVIQAQTLASGEKGQIILVADMGVGTTTVSGKLDASAPNGGDGGFIETSGAHVKVADSAKITTKSAQGQSGNWLIDPTDYTVAASGGDITGALLSSQLASNGTVTIQSTQGGTEGSGDINVNDSVTWNSAALNLKAERNININKNLSITDGDANFSAKGSINVNAEVTTAGTSVINFIYGANADYSANAAAVPSDTAALNMGMNQSGFTGKINVGANGQVMINGVIYTVVRDAAGLANIQNGLTGRYVLASDLDLSGFNGAVWTPIGNGSNAFSGHLEGWGHVVSNMTVNAPNGNYAGLFGRMAGQNSQPAAVTNLGVSGTVAVTAPTTGVFAGGLVASAGGGTLSTPALLRNVYSQVEVSATGTGTGAISVGGLVGTSSVLNLTNAFATRKVSGTSGGTITVGGLVGTLNGGSALSRAYAIGEVSATSTSLSGASVVGGLVGGVTGGSGAAATSIKNVYATGSVTGSSQFAVFAGGLVGNLNAGGGSATLNGGFASGAVSGSSPTLLLGGLVGRVLIGGGSVSVSNAYWDATKTGQGSAVSPASASQPTLTNVFNVSVGTASTTYPKLDSTVWGVSNGTPYLLAIPLAVTTPTTTPVTYTLSPLTGSYVYKAADYNLADLWSSSTIFAGCTVCAAWTAGTDYKFTYGGNVVTGFTNANTYSNIGINVLKSGYAVAGSGNTTGTLTINPALISAVTGITAANKTYDASTSATLTTTGAGFTGLYSGDTLSVATATGNFADKDAASGKTVNITGITLGGSSAGNYTLATGANAATTTANITPAALTLTSNDFLSSATATPVLTSQSGYKDAGAPSLTLSNGTLGLVVGADTKASNYTTTVVIPGASGADLNVNRDLTVNGLNLTLQADRNININKVLTAQGATDKVTLAYGQGAVAVGNSADYVTNLVSDVGFSGKINLQAGQNFVTKLGSDGAPVAYTVITALGDLQGINSNVAGNYVLGGDIDASSGFTPLQYVPSGPRPKITPFSGTFDGLGHTINNLNISSNSGLSSGLFGSSTGTLRQVGLVGGTVSGGANVGALVGNQTGGAITRAFSQTSVSGTGNAVGGLVGNLVGGSISQSFSNGAVNAGGSTVGGLVGGVINAASVSKSHATGKVDGQGFVGGLAGSISQSTVTDVYATGAVSAFNNVGGLVGGISQSSLSRAFATGTVKSTASVETVNTSSYGGLAGYSNGSTLSNVYATGNVTGFSQVGGLLGGIVNGGSLSNSYATGIVSGTQAVGSIIGIAGYASLTSPGPAPTISGSFWNTDSAGQTPGVGANYFSQALSGLSGKTTAQLQKPFTYIDAGWDFAKVWGTSVSGANGGSPQLRSLSSGLYDDYVRVANGSKVYGSANSTITGAALSGVGTSNVSVSYGSAITTLTDAGDYQYSSPNVVSVTENVAGRSLYTDFSTGKLTVTPKALSISDSSVADKTYDGGTSATVTAGTLSGLVGDQLLGATTASGSFADANAGTGKNVAVTYTLADSSTAKAANYSLTGETLTGKITPKALSVTGTTVSGKTYDGSKTATVTSNGMLSGFIDDETVVFNSVTGTFTDANAAKGKAVTVKYTLANGSHGGLAGNYSLADATGLTADITPKALTMTGSSVASKTYDGSKTASVTVGTLSGLVTVSGVTESLGTTTASGSFADKNAGTDKDVTVKYTLANGVPTMPMLNSVPNETCATPPVCASTSSSSSTGTGALASNYSLADQTLKGAISQKKISIVAGSVSKTYDGTTSATGNGTLFDSVLASGDAINSVGSQAFLDKNAGSGNKTVRASGVTIKDDSGVNMTDNYAIRYVDNTASTISKAALTVTAVAASKTYDGGTSAAGTGTVGTLASGDAVNSAGSQAFLDKNAGTGKTVRASGVTIKDGSSVDMTGNYAITYVDNTASTIMARVLTMTGSTVASKTYDGSKTASVTVGTLSGLVEGETLGTTTATGSFDSKNAGTDKDVTVKYTLANGVSTSSSSSTGTGALASNYSLADQTKTASIGKKELTINGFAANGKTYDGNATATIANAGSLAGVIEADLGKVTLGNTGATFADKHAGKGKTVTLNGVGLSGTESGNYVLAKAPVTALADIAARGGVSVMADAQSKLVGAADPALTYRVSGLLAGDVLTGALSRAPGEAAGLYAILLGGVGNPNYMIDSYTPAILTVRAPVSDTAVANVQVRQQVVIAPQERPVPLQAPTTAQNSFIVPSQQGTSVTLAEGRLIVVSGGVRQPSNVTFSDRVLPGMTFSEESRGNATP